jgi:hypothetical protein
MGLGVRPPHRGVGLVRSRIGPWLVGGAAWLVVIALTLVFTLFVVSTIHDHDTKVVMAVVIGFIGGVPAALLAMAAKSWAEER